MSRRQMRRQRHAAEPDHPAVSNHTANVDRGKRHPATRPVTNVTVFKKGLIGSTRNHRCATCPLQSREPARMINVRVTVEQIFHIANVKSQCLYIADNLRRRLGENAVDQDMAFG